MNNNDFITVKKSLSSSNHLLSLDRENRLLIAFEKVDADRLFKYHSIRNDFDTSPYNFYEKCRSIPCVFGKPSSPTPKGVFQVEHKSKDEYLSEYYPKLSRVKFFGYLVLFEDYFIHSDLYGEDTTRLDIQNGTASSISKKDDETSGCIRVNQQELDWLLDTIDIGTVVIL